ncbi:MAG: CHAD domain-containing protein [Solirubrobacterales bacterium]
MSKTRSDRVAAAILLGQLDQFEARLPGAISGQDPEDLHQLRIAVRRSRSLQHGLHEIFPPDELARSAEGFKWLQQLTNSVRDLDVLLADCDAAAEQRPELARGFAALRREISKRRTAERRGMRRGLESRRAAALVADWRSLLAQLPGDSREIGAIVGPHVRRQYRKIVATGRAVVDDPDPEKIHDLRKRAKNLRYFVEAFEDRYPKRVVKPLRADLKALHAVLGAFQDGAVQERLLRELADQLSGAGAGSEPLLAIGCLFERAAAARTAAIAEYPQTIESLAGKQLRAGVKSAFG